MTNTQKRLLEISYKHGLSHISSCLTALPIIEHIYDKKQENEPFVLSNGHCGLALYIVIEKHGGRNAEEILEHHGTHPDACLECGLALSTGSLGQGLPIAVGMSLADPERKIYCLISDGECAEGSIWESLRIIKDKNIENIEVHININGWGAYDPINTLALMDRLYAFHYPKVWLTNLREFPEWLRNQNGHYVVMNDEQYQEVMK